MAAPYAPNVLQPPPAMAEIRVPEIEGVLFVLNQMEDVPVRYWLHGLMHQIEGAKWITLDPYLITQKDGLTDEERSPVEAGLI